MRLEAERGYRGARLALLTQHGKERVVGPLLEEALGAEVSRVSGFDTDTLGTFTRDVPRAGHQLDAARKKARIAIERSGLPLGLGSEGSFSAGPFGLTSTNLELVVLLDDARGLEIVGRAHAPGWHFHTRVFSRVELDDAASRFGFPEHGLVLRPDDENGRPLFKGLDRWSALDDAYARARASSSQGVVAVESELRAHLNPTRMKNIAAATADLIARMRSCCPACDAPGFGLARLLPGRRCRDCRFPTRLPKAEEHACVRCGHQRVRDLDAPPADPGSCDRCNP